MSWTLHLRKDITSFIHIGLYRELRPRSFHHRHSELLQSWFQPENTSFIDRRLLSCPSLLINKYPELNSELSEEIYYKLYPSAFILSLSPDPFSIDILSSRFQLQEKVDYKLHRSASIRFFLCQQNILSWNSKLYQKKSLHASSIGICPELKFWSFVHQHPWLQSWFNRRKVTTSFINRRLPLSTTYPELKL